jgi:Asp/Glu/hydantoin racemase
VACYSAHPLVPALQAATNKPVTGILEASVGAALMILQPTQSFGIVSTGKIWEELLATAVIDVLGGQSSRFAGVETTGLSAKKLHDAPMDDVKTRMVDATRRLLRRGNVRAVCLGCAAMVGFDIMVREAAIAELGEDEGRKVKVVDGVVAASGVLRSLVVCQR